MDTATVPTRSDEFDIAAFEQAVERHWKHHATCHQLFWSVHERDDGISQIEVAPIYQEVFGNKDDGMKVWTGFEFDLGGFLAEPGVDVEEFGALSYCAECSPTPFIGFRGTYRGPAFVMKLHLEPIPDTEPREVLDTLKREVRAIEETHP